eukprot:s3343_g8.t1
MAPKPQPFGKHDDDDEETDLLRGRWPRNRPKPGKDVEDDLLPFGIKADCRTMAAAVACVLLVGIVLIKVTMFPGATEYERPVDTSRPPTRTTASPAMIDSLPPSLRGQPPIGMSANALQTTSNPAGAFQQIGQAAAPGSAGDALTGPGDGDGDADDGSGKGYGDNKAGGPKGAAQAGDSDASDGPGDEPSTPGAGQAQVGDSAALDGPDDEPSTTTADQQGAAQVGEGDAGSEPSAGQQASGDGDQDDPGGEPSPTTPTTEAGQQASAQVGDVGALDGPDEEPSTSPAGQQGSAHQVGDGGALDGPGEVPSTTAAGQQRSGDGDASDGPGHESSTTAARQPPGSALVGDRPGEAPSTTVPGEEPSTTAAEQPGSAQVGDGGALDGPGDEPSTAAAGQQRSGDGDASDGPGDEPSNPSTTAAVQQGAAEGGDESDGPGAEPATTAPGQQGAVQDGGGDVSDGLVHEPPTTAAAGQQAFDGPGDELSTTAADQQGAAQVGEGDAGSEPSAGQQASGDGDQDDPGGEPSPTTPTTEAGQQASAQVGDVGALNGPGEEPSTSPAGQQEAGDEPPTTAVVQKMAGQEVGDGGGAVDTTVSNTELAGQHGDELSTTAPDYKSDGLQGAGGIEPAQQGSVQEPVQGDLSTTAADQQAAGTTTTAAVPSLDAGQRADLPLTENANAELQLLRRAPEQIPFEVKLFEVRRQRRNNDSRWLGSEPIISRFFFVLAVIVTDLCAQGADMSPSGTLTKLIEGLAYARSLSRIASQLLAAVVAHLLLERLSGALDLPLLSGPTPKEGVGLPEMCIDEAAATFLLMATIFAATSFLSERLWLLQELIIAGAIHYNLENLNRAGAAMNPMMGSGWAIYAASRRQALPRTGLAVAPHILCYWFSSMLGAIGAWLSIRLPVLLFNRWRRAAESKAKSD